MGRNAPARHPLRLPPFAKTGLFLSLAGSALVAVLVLVAVGGSQYYWAAQDVRAYTSLHSVLRPSGVVGRSLGIGGVALMTLMHVYSVRKRARWSDHFGSINFWLEAHIFCGVLGPVLITFHTAFKFNGLVSVAYWSMIIVVASGFVGRYLYLRIPRSIKGTELSCAEMEEKVERLRQRVAAADLPERFRASIVGLERAVTSGPEGKATWMGLLFGDLGLRMRLSRSARSIRKLVADRALVDEHLALVAERAYLRRRIAYLKKTKQLFDLWRVYHKPLAALMVLIVVVHVVLVWYFGYAFGRG